MKKIYSLVLLIAISLSSLVLLSSCSLVDTVGGGIYGIVDTVKGSVNDIIAKIKGEEPDANEGEENEGENGGAENSGPKEVYFVTFDNGGKTTSVSIKEGGKLTPPESPSKPGYNFSGWYSNGKLWDFENDTVTGKTTKRESI